MGQVDDDEPTDNEPVEMLPTPLVSRDSGDVESSAGRTRRTKRCTDPTKAMAKQLYGTTSKCGEPDCPEPLIRIVDGRRTLNSRIAHIQGSAPDGPRADPWMTCDEVNDFDNLIVLCLFHADEVDQHVDEFPKEMLREWKARALADHEQLQHPVNLTDHELSEAVATVTRSSVATGALVELAKAIQSLRLAALRSRSAPQASWDRFQRQRDARERERVIWDAETGERLRAELSPRDPLLLAYQDEATEALNEVYAEIRPRADRVVEAAAGVAAAADMGPEALGWLERSVEAVVDAATSFNPDDPLEPLNAALNALTAAGDGMKALSAGRRVDIPPPPVEPQPPGPTAEDRLVDQYVQLYESASRYTRVEHLPYDIELHQRLLAFAPHLVAVPPMTMSFMAKGLTLSQNADVAAAVARNATDDEFNQLLAQIQISEPEAVRASYLRALRRHIPDDHQARVDQVEAALADLAQHVVTELATAEFWNRNASHSSDVVSLALTVVGTPTIEEAVRSALDNAELAVPILIHVAPVIDRRDSRTGEHQETVATYRSTRWVPSWLPTDLLEKLIIDGQLNEGDDETARLATEFLSTLDQIRRDR